MGNGNGWRSRGNVTRGLVGMSALFVFVFVAMAMVLASLVPMPRGAMSWRNAVPVDQELRTLNRVSHWPQQWVDAVCEPPLYQLRNYGRLPHATYTAACRSLVEYAGHTSNLMVARYSDELPMQVDLGAEEYEFYSFASWYGELFVVATASDESVTGANGLGVSPFLQPLEQFGFTVYSGPGPP